MSELAKTLRFFLRGYQYFISPALAWVFGTSCRFYPSCSEYARECLGRLPLRRASVLIVKRVGRCHPFCRGGWDPVPITNERRQDG